MSRIKQFSFIVLAATLTLAACTGSSDNADTATAQEASTATGKAFLVDTLASEVDWKATHKGGFAPRFGTLKLTEGNIAVDNGSITGGNFTIDINSLWVDTTSVTEPGKKATDLQNHLKSPDFFDATNFPSAKFVITGVAPYDSTKSKSLVDGATNLVSGNLTIKDSTLNVTFPAKISVNENDVDIEAKFSVDRTSWGLRYGAEGDPADWMISKDFELDLNVKTSAK